MVKGYKITAEATVANAATKTQSFSIRSISKEEALKEAEKYFSSGSWNQGDYEITSVQVWEIHSREWYEMHLERAKEKKNYRDASFYEAFLEGWDAASDRHPVWPPDATRAAKDIGTVEIKCEHCGRSAACSAETTLYGVEWLCVDCAEENEAQQEQMRRNSRPHCG